MVSAKISSNSHFLGVGNPKNLSNICFHALKSIATTVKHDEGGKTKRHQLRS